MVINELISCQPMSNKQNSMCLFNLYRHLDKLKGSSDVFNTVQFIKFFNRTCQFRRHIFDFKIFDFNIFDLKIFDFNIFDFNIFDIYIFNFNIFDDYIFDFNIFDFNIFNDYIFDFNIFDIPESEKVSTNSHRCRS